MSTELDLIAKELEPAVAELIEASGILAPVRELTGVLADTIHYRWRVPHATKLIVDAAEKIKATGIPPRGVPDKLLVAVLEDGILEDDESMRERWAALLAHQATVEDVPPAIPEILKQLQPVEARALDALADMTVGYVDAEKLGLREAQTGNLERLGLIHQDPAHARTTLTGFLATKFPPIFAITPLGRELVDCCREIS